MNRTPDTGGTLTEGDINFDLLHGHNHDGLNSRKIDGSSSATATTTTIVTGSAIVEIPWCNDGSVIAITSTPEVRSPVSITLSGMSATITTAGSTTTTVALYKNGVSVQTLNLTSGITYNYIQFVSPVSFIARVDRYQVRVTAAGTGATGIAGALEASA